MEPIREGAVGAAVEDIQARLDALGYVADEAERAAQTFGPSTATAVARFRLEHDLPLGSEVDTITWSTLVDEGYCMGDRTLYLRLPNFHGADVRQLQKCLNILGFSCGEADGYYGVHTEAAVKQFQESQGQLADGMAFPDTFDAIDRLHHVWGGKPAAGPHPMGGMGFARAAEVLERMQISLAAEDPISRNIAGRIWNLSSATTEHSGLDLIMDAENTRAGDQLVLILASNPLPSGQKMPNLMTDDMDTLPQRIHTAFESSRRTPPLVRLEMPLGSNYDGTFTTGDAQTLAVVLLDAICMAFE
ncbi:MAG: peptidoglycan-binding domain-containing protein [Atopobiaceae bacterium]|nr:peptidoglycan-binding domain-containing protein [Atopobiaceae bacterium]